MDQSLRWPSPTCLDDSERPGTATAAAAGDTPATLSLYNTRRLDELPYAYLKALVCRGVRRGACQGCVSGYSSGCGSGCGRRMCSLLKRISRLSLLFSYLNTPHPLSITHRTLTPYHNREMITSLKRDCLCNYDFVLAKLLAGNHEYRDDLCADYEMTLRTVSGGDADVKLISDTLAASGHAVKRHCSQLSSQVSGAPARVAGVCVRTENACGCCVRSNGIEGGKIKLKTKILVKKKRKIVRDGLGLVRPVLGWIRSRQRGIWLTTSVTRTP